jgi:hypothetical protein
MARSRNDLQEIFEDICPNVYFQPPANVQMIYPAIVYERGRADSKFADDRPYSVTKQYSVTLISRNPDETIFEALAALPMCGHERFFVVENLNHDVFNIYF